MLEIDWTTAQDRQHHNYKASTIHGWLRMWRGTLAGNERVRQQGRQEMKAARAIRAYHRKHGGNNGPFSFFGLGGSGKRPNVRVVFKPQRHKSSGSRHHRSDSHHSKHSPRSAPPQRKSSSGANRGHHHASRQGHTPARPEPMRHRSSHSSKRPSRQASGRR